MEQEGKQIQREVENKANEILAEKGFSLDGTPSDWSGGIKIIPEIDEISEEAVIQAIEAYNQDKAKDFQIGQDALGETFENPFTSINVSIDEVGVKKQKETRDNKVTNKKKDGFYIRNTII